MTSSPALSRRTDYFAQLAQLAQLAQRRQFAPLSVNSSGPILLKNPMNWWWWLTARMPCRRQRILVNLDDHKTAIRGVLFEQRGSWLVLKDAHLCAETRTPVAMDGDVVIACDRVLFTQVVS